MITTRELQHNGQQPGEYDEIGSAGLEAYSGFITKAYNAKLHWPGVEPVYSRIWRSDPETTIVRQMFSALSGRLVVSVELPEQQGGRELGDPTDDDLRAQDYVYSVLDDLEGGPRQWITDANTRAPFFGWGYWEAVPAMRRANWTPPNDDPWRSEYDDGLPGFRRLALRDYSSFWAWDMDDRTGFVHGMEQHDPPNTPVTIPIERAVHVRYGDMNNPEGLATLEAIWRLERLLYGLEVVFGIGAEHTAGHLSVTVEEGSVDTAKIKAAASAIMTAQEGNYAAWPKGTMGTIIDSTFTAAADIQAAIQNYRVLKLALFGMQFVGISTMTGAGSYASLNDSSAMGLLIFNSITEGNMGQLDEQLIKRLFRHPAVLAAFPNLTRRPMLTVNTIGKKVNLVELVQFAQGLNAIMPLGDDDLITIRQASELLPEQLPEDKNMGDIDPIVETPEPDEQEEPADMARPLVTGEDEYAIDVMPQAMVTVEDAEQAVRGFRRWAEKNAPRWARLLDARAMEKGDDG